MEPVSIVVAALAAGAVAGAQNTATDAVKDAYATLKRLVHGRLSGRVAGEVALTEHERRPDRWSAALAAELADAGAGDDPRIVAAAQRLMEVVDPSASRHGKYRVDARGAHGVYIGDGGTQHNTF